MVINPSITLVTAPVDVKVISISYRYLAGASKTAVCAGVNVNVITPVVASLATVEVMVVLDLVDENPSAILAKTVYPVKLNATPSPSLTDTFDEKVQPWSIIKFAIAAIIYSYY